MSDRLCKLLAWAALAFVIFATVSPIELRPHDVLPVNLDRALAFAVLCALFVMAYPRHFMLVAAIIIVGAFAIEFLQYLEPSRHPRLHDAIIKAVGAAIGMLGGWLINRYRAVRT